jgi:hypothetical protein
MTNKLIVAAAALILTSCGNRPETVPESAIYNGANSIQGNWVQCLANEGETQECRVWNEAGRLVREGLYAAYDSRSVKLIRDGYQSNSLPFLAGFVYGVSGGEIALVAADCYEGISTDELVAWLQRKGAKFDIDEMRRGDRSCYFRKSI